MQPFQAGMQKMLIVDIKTNSPNWLKTNHDHGLLLLTFIQPFEYWGIASDRGRNISG